MPKKLDPPVTYKPCDFTANGVCTGLKPDRILTDEEVDTVADIFEEFAKTHNSNMSVKRIYNKDK